MTNYKILHHGATQGVTGSCHELQRADGRGVLIDCGLFQGDEASPEGAGARNQEIDFPLDHIQALLVTHVHIDHVGRIPYLLAAGFDGPIYCSEASAALLPMVLEDALKVGFTRNQSLIQRVMGRIRAQIRPLPYGQWHELLDGETPLAARLQPAGHILGSAYIELRLARGQDQTTIVFSGDLGPPHTPLLPDPQPPAAADTLVLESTYGDRRHEDRTTRARRLQAVVEHALKDRGAVLIPAFSIGRTQELLYELEQIIQANRERPAAPNVPWDDIEIILDSPLAADFTQGYRRLRANWDQEAKQRVASGRHPLAFDQLLTIDDHQTHLQTVEYLAQTARPAIVIAASGMCSGGRIVNYLKAMLGDPRHDILFVGYQAAGTPGRAIQHYGPSGGYVELDGRRHDIKAQIHTIGGYSAHADRENLLDFVQGIPNAPKEIRLVHGDPEAKRDLAKILKARFQHTQTDIP